MTAALNFTLDHDHGTADVDGEGQLVGWITCTTTSIPGDFRARALGTNPKTVRLLPFRGYLAADGHMYKDQTRTEPFRLVANDPDFNLHHLTYRVDFDLTTVQGVPVPVPRTYFPAPSTDTVVYLTRFLRQSNQTVMEARTKAYAEDILDITSVGIALLTSSDLSDLLGELGATEVGQQVLAAASDRAARAALLVPSDYDEVLYDTREPINGSVSLAKLDAELAAFVTAPSAVSSPYFQALANGNVLNAHNNTDATQKVVKFGVPHYTNTEEPVYGLRCESNSGSTYVQVGGGSATGNAATQIQFYTAADATTLIGTLRAYIDNAGAFAIANTTDQTTNYEKGVARFNSNVFEVGTFYGGTGTTRAVKFGVAGVAGSGFNRYLLVQASGPPFFTFVWGTTGASDLVNVGSGSTLGGSGAQAVFTVTPTVNQTGAGGYTAVLVNVTETVLGSGTKRLIDAQVGGVSKFSVDNTGKLTISGTTMTISGGSGTPEGVVTATVGSQYMRSDGGAATAHYVKESGSGNTGWVAK